MAAGLTAFIEFLYLSFFKKILTTFIYLSRYKAHYGGQGTTRGSSFLPSCGFQDGTQVSRSYNP